MSHVEPLRLVVLSGSISHEVRLVGTLWGSRVSRPSHAHHFPFLPGLWKPLPQSPGACPHSAWTRARLCWDLWAHCWRRDPRPPGAHTAEGRGGCKQAITVQTEQGHTQSMLQAQEERRRPRLGVLGHPLPRTRSHSLPSGRARDREVPGPKRAVRTSSRPRESAIRRHGGLRSPSRWPAPSLPSPPAPWAVSTGRREGLQGLLTLHLSPSLPRGLVSLPSFCFLLSLPTTQPFPPKGQVEGSPPVGTGGWAITSVVLSGVTSLVPAPQPPAAGIPASPVAPTRSRSSCRLRPLSPLLKLP